LEPYIAAMASTLIRLVALMALILMPLGMGAAPALVAPGPHSMTMAVSGHCDGQQDPDKAPAQKQMNCTAACTALPAPSAPVLPPALKPTARRMSGVDTIFTGIEPEIATPPPKGV
jgi:hypothetical protein